MTNLKRAQLLRRRVDRLGRGLSIWIVATLGLPLAILVAAISSPAQAPGKVPHIGYLWIGAEGSDRVTRPGLQQGLRELGYQEGHDIIIEYRNAGGSIERLRELVAEMIASKVDIIVAPGLIIADALKRETTTIPIVALVGDPIPSGLVASLARPGGNITGFSAMVPEYGGKLVELLHELMPNATRVAVLWNPSNAASRDLVQAIRADAARAGLSILLHEAHQSADFPVVFDAITGEELP